jgi:hypothetical protein
VPAVGKTCEYVAPTLDVGAVAQLVLFGEQNWLSIVQVAGAPLVTVWPEATQTH